METIKKSNENFEVIISKNTDSFEIILNDLHPESHLVFNYRIGGDYITEFIWLTYMDLIGNNEIFDKIYENEIELEHAEHLTVVHNKKKSMLDFCYSSVYNSRASIFIDENNALFIIGSIKDGLYELYRKEIEEYNLDYLDYCLD